MLGSKIQKAVTLLMRNVKERPKSTFTIIISSLTVGSEHIISAAVFQCPCFASRKADTNFLEKNESKNKRFV